MASVRHLGFVKCYILDSSIYAIIFFYGMSRCQQVAPSGEWVSTAYVDDDGRSAAAASGTATAAASEIGTRTPVRGLDDAEA